MFGHNKNTNPKIIVFIKQEPIDIAVKCPIELSSDGTKAWVTIEEETEKKAGWKLDVTGCIRPSKAGLYVEAIRGATKAIKIDVENKEYTFSKLTNDQMQDFVNQKIFKAHYGKLLGDLIAAIKPYLIVLAVVVIISIAVGGYNAWTLSKIPSIGIPIQPTSTPPVVIG